MTFHVGQKVVCVNAKREPNRPNAHLETLPVEGQIYTIREAKQYESGPGYLLVEIKNPILEYKQGMSEIHFKHYRFRPVQTTDISVFTAMLNPTPEVIEQFKKELVDG